jgi:hypothetical protein
MLKIFISYKSREHKKHIGLIKKTLDGTGLAFWWDEENKVPNFRMMGLDGALRSGLRQADVLLFLIPQQQYKLTGWERFGDFLDLIGLALGTKYGENLTPVFLQYQFMWYQFAYDINIRKESDESWQEWELRMAESFGVPVVSVKIVDGELTPAINENGICLLRNKLLEEDFRSKVIPQLISRSKEKQKLEVKAELTSAIRENMRYINLIGVILLFYLAIFIAIETIKEVILWVPRKIWQFICWMARYILKAAR